MGIPEEITFSLVALLVLPCPALIYDFNPFIFQCPALFHFIFQCPTFFIIHIFPLTPGLPVGIGSEQFDRRIINTKCLVGFYPSIFWIPSVQDELIKPSPQILSEYLANTQTLRCIIIFALIDNFGSNFIPNSICTGIELAQELSLSKLTTISTHYGQGSHLVT